MKKTIQQVQKRWKEYIMIKNLNETAKSIKKAFRHSKREDRRSACSVEFELHWTEKGELQLAGQSYRKVYDSEYKLITQPIEQELREEFLSRLEARLVDEGIEMLTKSQKAKEDGEKTSLDPLFYSMVEPGLAVFLRASF